MTKKKINNKCVHCPTIKGLVTSGGDQVRPGFGSIGPKAVEPCLCMLGQPPLSAGVQVAPEDTQHEWLLFSCDTMNAFIMLLWFASTLLSFLKKIVYINKVVWSGLESGFLKKTKMKIWFPNHLQCMQGGALQQQLRQPTCSMV